MGYFLHLSFRYIRKNPARTAYSVLGIMLTCIMCFALLTTFYSFWDYDYLDYYRQYPFELSTLVKGEGWTTEMIENAKRMEKEESIEELNIRVLDNYSRGGSRRVLSSQMKLGEEYALWIKLKDTSDLKRSAEELTEKYHFELHIQTVVARYLRQDESDSTAMTNLLLTMSLAIFGGFFVAILRNTMLIAVTERVRDYGLLRCVGMSESQLLGLLCTEGLLMSLLASILGTTLGYGGMQLLEPWIRKTLDLSEVFRFGFYPKAVILTLLLMIAVTLFSLIEPARQAGLVSPLDALHGIYSSMQKVKKEKPAKGGAEEKLFGAAGFYAKRNFRRGKGHQWAVFLAMLFSVTFLLTVLSFCDSYTETIKKAMRLDTEGLSTYLESLRYQHYSGGSYVISVYDPEELAELQEELQSYPDVKDTVSVMEGYSSLEKESLLWPDPKIRKITEENYGGIYTKLYANELGYEEAAMEQDRAYLTEGEMDYERMKAEKGILICDFNGNGERLTDYKAGDTITALSVRGAFEALSAYSDVIAAVSERNGLDAWMNERNDIVSFADGKKTIRKQDGTPFVCLFNRTKKGMEDMEFDRLKQEVLTELAMKGFDCMPYLREDAIRMLDILYALQAMEYEKGYTETFQVMGILSDDFYEPVRSYESTNIDIIRIVYPAETLLSRIEEIRSEAERTGFEIPGKGLYTQSPANYVVGASYYTEIGVRRDAELLDPEILKFSRKLENWEYLNRTDAIDYFEMVQELKVARMAVTILGVFIITICMVQIINTLQANMRLRRRELWLYTVVGMSPADRLKMQLVEHGLSALAALVFAMLTSFLFSFIVIKKLLDVEGDSYSYRWPWPTALILTAMITAIILTVNLLEMKRSN